METMYIGNKCPNCGSEQFSICTFDFDKLNRPPEFNRFLGTADCRSCHKEFFVCLAPELERAIRKITKELNILRADALINILFRGNFGEFGGSQ